MITNLRADLRLKLYTRTRRFAFFDAGMALGYIVGLPLGTWLTNNHGLVAVFLTSSSFFLLTFTSLTPYLGMGMMGVAYSILVSALWPIAALMVTVSMQSSIK